MNSDAFYTPSEISEKMIGAIEAGSADIVADFAAGAGDLLEAARARWPLGRIVATDISRAAVMALKRIQPRWEVGRCDFLSGHSRGSCRVLSGLENRVSVVLLNPPFSCRGGTICRVIGNGYEMQSSRGMAFVLNALRYLAPDGELVCVLPAGSLHTQKDQRAWAFLRTFFHVYLVSRNGHKTFDGCFARTVLVRLRRRALPRRVRNATSTSGNPKADLGRVTLYRGRLPMYVVKGEGGNSVPLIHSTCLRHSSVDFKQFATGRLSHAITGPTILLPRVGRPDKSKVVLYRGRRLFVMSDCVLGLQCAFNPAAVHSHILKEWSLISRLYKGTGARFLTVAALAEGLRGLGIEVGAPKGRHYSRQLTEQIGQGRKTLAWNEIEALASRICGRNGDE